MLRRLSLLVWLATTVVPLSAQSLHPVSDVRYGEEPYGYHLFSDGTGFLFASESSSTRLDSTGHAIAGSERPIQGAYLGDRSSRIWNGSGYVVATDATGYLTTSVLDAAGNRIAGPHTVRRLSWPAQFALVRAGDDVLLLYPSSAHFVARRIDSSGRPSGPEIVIAEDIDAEGFTAASLGSTALVVITYRTRSGGPFLAPWLVDAASAREAPMTTHLVPLTDRPILVETPTGALLLGVEGGWLKTEEIDRAGEVVSRHEHAPVFPSVMQLQAVLIDEGVLVFGLNPTTGTPVSALLDVDGGMRRPFSAAGVGPGHGDDFQVVSNGRQAVAAWAESGSIAAPVTAEGVAGARYYPPRTASGQWEPQVACDRSGCLVVWIESDPKTGGTLRSKRIDLDGVPVEGTERVVFPGYPIGVTVTAADSGYLVVWKPDFWTLSGSLLARRVRSDGSLDGPPLQVDDRVQRPLDLDTPTHAVGSDGSNWLVAWPQAVGDGDSDYPRVAVRLVSKDGQLGTTTVLPEDYRAFRVSSVVWTGYQYVATFGDWVLCQLSACPDVTFSSWFATFTKAGLPAGRPSLFEQGPDTRFGALALVGKELYYSWFSGVPRFARVDPTGRLLSTPQALPFWEGLDPLKVLSDGTGLLYPVQAGGPVPRPGLIRLSTGGELTDLTFPFAGSAGQRIALEPDGRLLFAASLPGEIRVGVGSLALREAAIELVAAVETDGRPIPAGARREVTVVASNRGGGDATGLLLDLFPMDDDDAVVDDGGASCTRGNAHLSCSWDRLGTGESRRIRIRMAFDAYGNAPTRRVLYGTLVAEQDDTNPANNLLSTEFSVDPALTRKRVVSR